MDKQKIVWITGASSGIGKALAVKFALNGVHVAAAARRKNLLDSIKGELGNNSTFFHGYKLDISDFESVEAFYKEISGNFEVECLINNAGTTSFQNAIDNSFDEIKNIISVNLLGSIRAIKSVLPGMIERKSGTIINILSVVTQKIFTASSAYSASKSGLHAYSKVLREEIRDKNVRIINVSPGATATDIWPEGALKRYSERMMNADNIADLVYRVYSEKSNMVSEELVLRPIKGDL
ncbi:MAG: hypothetical protein CVV24_10625 [Ignavibacteriae bacterium HGW-Ignavibacteriae-3]|nr:MAG: hypothetical protein CVV24_10625 [Ignavibacteriae bacterium HGW-Ignavibacteriae-3]